MRERAVYLEAILTLLRRAREVGIPAAQEEFELWRHLKGVEVSMQLGPLAAQNRPNRSASPAFLQHNIGKCYEFLAWIEEQQGNTAAVAHYGEALRCLEQVQSPKAEKVRANLRRLGEEA